MRSFRIAIMLLAVAQMGSCTGPPDDQSDASSAGHSSFASASEAIAACLRDKGWDASAHPDNSVSARYPEDQQGMYMEAYAVCQDEARPFTDVPPLNMRQAEEYFDQLLAAASCIRDLGYDVAEPPSRQAAVSALQQPTIDLGWDPYEDAILSARTGNDVDKVFQTCPQPAWPS